MDSPSTDTRAALIAVALRHFGRAGFEGTSTRTLASAAGTNISSIAYHFGGKDGLRMACADELIARVTAATRAVDHAPATMTRAQARHLLRRLMRRLVTFMTGTPATEDLVRFLLRELSNPDSAVVDRLYHAVIAPRHAMLCRIWGVATGTDPDSEDVKLAVLSLFGQVAYFRVAAPVVQRRLGWTGYPRPAVRAMTARLMANLDAMLGVDHG